MSQSIGEKGGARFCPVCGSEAGERFCPVDGTLMVRRQRPDPAALHYGAGHIIDQRYRILRSIGRGGFGAVYAATHTGTGQQVALKVLHVDTGADNQQMIRRFWQEAQITSRLRHANTVRVFDVGQTEEGAFYLAMEHLHGHTLADELDERPGSALSEGEAAAIGIEICKSLQEAHRAGLVHRDLKPANVMLCEAGERSDEAAIAGRWQVKVLDFGIARTADSSLTGQGAALGTPAFMSPEQCRGLDVGPRSDLYSLGVVLFRCVTGRLPFIDENPLAILFHHADTPAPDPRRLAPQPLSAAMAECLIKVLSKKPEDRYADAREMQQALQTVLLGTPALAGAALSPLESHRAATMLLETPQPRSTPVPPPSEPPANSPGIARPSAGSAAPPAAASPAPAPAAEPAAEPAAALQAAMGQAWGWKLMALALAGFAVAALVLVFLGQGEEPAAPPPPLPGPALQAAPGAPVAPAPALAAPAAAPAAAAPAGAEAAPSAPAPAAPPPAAPAPAAGPAAAGEPGGPKAAPGARRADRPAAAGSDRAFELRDEAPAADRAADKAQAERAAADRAAAEKAAAERAAAEKAAEKAAADKAAAERAAAEKAAAEKAAEKAAKPAKPVEKPTALD